MSAYLVEVDDTKGGVCYPVIVGPFTSPEEARAFAEEMSMGRAAEDQGGYSAAHVISGDTCTHSPEKYREDYSWRLEEM